MLGRADDGLGSQVKNGVDLVFAEGPLQQFTVAEVAAHAISTLEPMSARTHSLWGPNRPPDRPRRPWLP